MLPGQVWRGSVAILMWLFSLAMVTAAEAATNPETWTAPASMDG